MKFILNHSYIFLTILLTVLSQLIIKWKMSEFNYSDYPTFQDKFVLAFSMLINPLIVLALIFVFLSGLSWIIALTKFQLSYAYPFMSLSLIFVTISSIVIFGEVVNFQKIFGIMLVIFGIIILSWRL